MWKIKIVHHIDLVVSLILYNNKLKMTVGEGGVGGREHSGNRSDFWAAAGSLLIYDEASVGI